MKNPVAVKLGLREKIGYAFGDTAANIAWRGLTFFLTYFYLEVYKLPPAAVGTLLLICRISDGFTDVIMGMIADRTETRFGKFRPWILWSALPLGVLMALIYLAPEFSPGGKIIYAYVTYIMLTLAYTANNVPYSALMGVMTGDYRERTSLSSFRFFGAYFGGFIVQGSLLYLVDFFGKDNEVAGFRNTMFLFAGILVAFLMITFFSTRERVKPPSSQSTTVKSDLKDLISNRPWLILLLLGLLWVTFNSIKQGVTVLYFKHYMGNKDLATSYMIAGLLVSMLAALVTAPLARFFGNKRLFLYTMILTGFFTSLIYIVGKSNVTMVFIFGTVAEFFAGIMPVLFFTMLGDSADYSEWKWGRRATGLVYSAGTFAMKIGFGISGAVIGYVFAFYNYDASSEIIHPNALQGARLLMSFIPTIFIILAIVLMLFYPLTKQRMESINSDLEARRTSELGAEAM